MSFLLDTNVVSEWVKPRPDPNVVRWLAETDEDRIFLSVMTFAEIRQGIEEMPAGKRRDALSDWLKNSLPPRFEHRVLPVNTEIAESCGVFMARCKRLGAPLALMDAFFAATAATHSFTLVTRNMRDFERLGIQLYNPWTA